MSQSLKRQFKYEDHGHAPVLIYVDVYKRYIYYITSEGLWPCIYVVLHHLNDTYDPHAYDWIDCHSGISYSKSYLKCTNFSLMDNIIGERVCSRGDKNDKVTQYFGMIEGHAWTTPELIKEAEHIIDQVSEKNL